MSSVSSAVRAPTIQLSTGAQLPVVGFGTWRAAPADTVASVYTALESGYRHIDCARIYANEKEVGAGITKAFNEKIVTREEVFITSKVWNTEHSRELALQSVRDSLADLQLKYLDLVLIHWPVHFARIPEKGSFPRDESGQVINETDASKASIRAAWEGLEDAFASGLTRAIGVSNFSSAQIDELMLYAKVKPVCNQVELHPFFPQDELLAYCKSKNIAVVQYSPLGNLNAGSEENDTPLKDPLIVELAAKYKKTPAQIILRWGIQHGQVVLPKSVTPSRIRENIDIFDFQLDQSDMEAIKKLGAKNKRFVNPNFNVGGTHVFAKL